MGLPRGAKVAIHTEVHLDRRTFEPSSASARQLWRFRHLGNSEEPAIEVARRLLAPRRHRELDVVDSNDRAEVPATRFHHGPNPTNELRRADGHRRA